MKKGILLLNLGTASDPSTPAVRRYLQEFLMDPRVIDIPWLLRFVLVYGVIGFFRAPKSAKAYQSIWTKDGSPLLVNSRALIEALSQSLGADFKVVLGMRYGEPSIQQAIDTLQAYNVDDLTILPLFPQYASASTGSALEACLKIIAHQTSIPSIQVIRDFHAMPGYIDAYADIIASASPPSFPLSPSFPRRQESNQKIDHLLFSYHGLPERHSDSDSYRAQCYETTRLIAEKLGLSTDRYQVCFQSRLGRTPWIKPYTDQVLIELYKQGIRSIAIVCPSFVSDCLETLEEVDMRAREQWLALGGESFHFIPCLNTHPIWVKALAKMVRTMTLSVAMIPPERIPMIEKEALQKMSC